MKSLQHKIIFILSILFILILVWISCVAFWLIWVGKQQNLIKADAIVVLGAAAYHSKPSPVFAERIKYGIDLYKLKLAPKIIFTGGFGTNAQFAESEVAKNFAIEQGIPTQDIIIETNSRNTFENLTETKKILHEHNLQAIIIVSDPLHMARAMRIAKRLDITAYIAATPNTRFKSLRTSWRFLAQEIYLFHRDLIWYF